MKMKSFLMVLFVVMSLAVSVPVMAYDLDPPQIEQSIEMDQSIQMEVVSVSMMQVQNPSALSLQLCADLEEKEPFEKSTINMDATITICEPVLHEVPG